MRQRRDVGGLETIRPTPVLIMRRGTGIRIGVEIDATLIDR